MEFNWHAFGRWVDEFRPWPYLLILWLLAWLALRLVQRLQLALKTHIVDRLGERRDPRRVETLMNVLRYAANIIIVVAATMWTLAAVGISITPLLATAGVAGIAIGFGAQSLVKDFFTGLFLLIENQVSEGDMIEAAGKAGVVERVTLRHMRIRDYDGGLHFIPNSMITTVTNRSRGFSYAVVDVEVPRQDDIEQAYSRLQRVGEEMRVDADVAQWILEDVEIAGVEKLGVATVSLRCRIKVRPAMQGPVRSEFLRRLKIALDEAQDLHGAG
jgi:small-conductance mechanosensitive channel